MYRKIYQKIENILKPNKCKKIFYSIFENSYKNDINNIINQLDNLLLRAQDTKNYDECLKKTIYFFC